MTPRAIIQIHYGSNVDFETSPNGIDTVVSSLAKRPIKEKIEVVERSHENWFFSNLTDEQRAVGNYGKRRRTKTSRRTRRSKK